jgi:hypothetical protein
MLSILGENLPIWLRRTVCGLAWALMGSLLGFAPIYALANRIEPVAEPERVQRLALFAGFVLMFWVVAWIPLAIIMRGYGLAIERKRNTIVGLLVLVVLALLFLLIPKYESLPLDEFAANMLLLGPVAWAPLGVLIASRANVWQATRRAIPIASIIGAVGGTAYGLFGGYLLFCYAYEKGILLAIVGAVVAVVASAGLGISAGAIVGVWVGSAIGCFRRGQQLSLLSATDNGTER